MGIEQGNLTPEEVVDENEAVTEKSLNFSDEEWNLISHVLAEKSQNERIRLNEKSSREDLEYANAISVLSEKMRKKMIELGI